MDIEKIKHIFSSSDQFAWIGSGGKTSLMFAIANHFFCKSLITTSTKMSREEIKLASHYYDLSLESSEGIDPLKFNEFGTHFIFNGYCHENTNKINGLNTEQLSYFSNISKKLNIPLLIEADGSKQSPIKAPGINEPVIPLWVNTVCVVVGLSGLEQQINDQTVFRKNIFQEITGSQEGEMITLTILEKYLKHSEGALKNIPGKSKKILFLNQADQIQLTDDVFNFCFSLTKTYDHVILCSVKQGHLCLYAHYGKISAVILAAGESKRFGSPKQLAVWKNKTLVEHVIHNLKESGLEAIKIILGANADFIKQKINNENIEILENPNWNMGQSTSVKLGIASLPEDCEAVIFLLVDQPQITPNIIKKVIQLFAVEKPLTIACSNNNIYYHPILFSSVLFKEFSEISGDIGGKNILKKYPPNVIFINNPYYTQDIDTLDDLKRI